MPCWAARPRPHLPRSRRRTTGTYTSTRYGSTSAAESLLSWQHIGGRLEGREAGKLHVGCVLRWPRCAQTCGSSFDVTGKPLKSTQTRTATIHEPRNASRTSTMHTVRAKPAEFIAPCPRNNSLISCHKLSVDLPPQPHLVT